jgi:hypothetical protein
MTPKDRTAEILAMRGVDARNSVRKEKSIDVLEELVGTDEVPGLETRVLVLKPAHTRLTDLKNAAEASAAKKTPPKKTPIKKTPAKKTAATSRTAPEGGPEGEKTCPSCSTTGDIASMFGYRRMKTVTKAGEKVRVSAQSHCRTCRAKKAKKTKNAA